MVGYQINVGGKTNPVIMNSRISKFTFNECIFTIFIG